MPTYIGFVDWTDQGVRSFRDTVNRSRQAREAFEAMGVQLREIFWTLGEHDIVAVFEADDDEAVAAATLALGAQGNLRTQTMRAFRAEEMERVLARTG